MIAHADDTTAFITSALSYKYLENENLEYCKVSGSKINTDKTEIYTQGNIEGLPKTLQKKSIKK